MKFEDIKEIFNGNNNKWMTSADVFECFDKSGYKWNKNARGIQGHKNIIARDLSQRYISKFEIDKNSKPQKYRLKNLDYDKSIDDDEVSSEVSIGIFLGDEVEGDGTYTDGNEEDLVSNEEETVDEFILDIENLQFQEHNMPLEGKGKKEKSNRRNTPRKFNYEKRARSNKIKGDLGEEAVVIMEKNKLRALGREDIIKSVEWVSKEKGDGVGYDIESWKLVGEELEKIYIEVKTTTGDINTSFDISDKEVSVSKQFGDRFYIYRLFGVEKVTSKINYYIINGDVEKKFDLVPTSFKAYLKIN